MVGVSFTQALGAVGFRWTAAAGHEAVMFPTVPSYGTGAYAASFDGSVLVGAQTKQAAYWTAATGLVGIGLFPGGMEDAWAKDVSNDGSVIVGNTRHAGGEEGFRWTQATGLVGLGDLPGGDFKSSAVAISADGSVIAGTARGASYIDEAYLWTAGTGMVGLGHANGGLGATKVFGLSADGSVVVGEAWFSGVGTRAFRWTAQSGFATLGTLGLPGESSVAVAASADGSVIVGTARGYTISPTAVYGPIPFIWDAQNGMRRLDVFLAQVGAAPTALIEEVKGISDDGTVVVGSIGPQNVVIGSWVAAIPVPEPSLTTMQVAVLACGVALRRFASRA